MKPLGLSWTYEAANRASGPKTQVGSMITKDHCSYRIRILRQEKKSS
jgi:hypothetical protein